jgi:hypothetical protein
MEVVEKFRGPSMRGRRGHQIMRAVVRLHTCISPGVTTGELILPPRCDCRARLTREEAERRVCDGKAIWRNKRKRELIILRLKETTAQRGFGPDSSLARIMREFPMNHAARPGEDKGRPVRHDAPHRTRAGRARRRLQRAPNYRADCSEAERAYAIAAADELAKKISSARL